MAALLVALAACGRDEPVPVPEGPPAARHGERALVEMTAFEDVRAGLASSSNLYAAGRAAAARTHVRRAREDYVKLLGRGVGGRDRALHREIVAAFDTIHADLGRTAGLAAVRERIGAVSGQLLGAAEALLVPAPARADAGARAEVLSRTLRALERAYRAGVQRGRAFEVERGYGLLARSQLQARGIVGSLGPQKDPVLVSLSNVRLRAYPVGVLRPPSAAPPEEVSDGVRTVRATLIERYRL